MGDGGRRGEEYPKLWQSIITLYNISLVVENSIFSYFIMGKMILRSVVYSVNNNLEERDLFHQG